MPAAAIHLPSQLWRANELAHADAPVLPTGYAALDAQLPGGGWPVGALVELLQDQSARHDWQLIAPALAARVRLHCGPVLLVGSPHLPFAPALAAQGLPADRLLWVGAADAGAQLWAVEQALRCAQVAAVLAWLPAARSQALRRLHLAAQAHSQLFFMFRPALAQRESSPAPLRLLLSASESDAPTALRVHIVKRRGPTVPAPLQLPTQQQRLHALLAATHARREKKVASITLPPVIADLIEAARISADAPASGKKRHALDRSSAHKH